MKSILESLYKKDSNGYYAIMAFSHTAHIFPVNNRQCRFDSLNDLEAAKKWIDNMDKLPQRYSTRLFMAMENAARTGASVRIRTILQNLAIFTPPKNQNYKYIFLNV